MEKLQGTYKIKAEFSELYGRHLSFAYRARIVEESEHVFISPLHTLKTGKATTLKQRSLCCTNVPLNHLEKID